ncbi:hypothetical protein JRO89_XS04G0058300 [Xanthoceras sorbifolium]|uniref:Uncharacterized protein n=1 Tax=Xanthoceras sorbifolium TaxID=99658 RepID=A0ABQ8I4B1_9ROSI|nr:hypothetical protein JRO89_XS04G0058300 [Xanthoceras sorbifolium]
MDFHSLTRKELQAICKKNKIPANITNVAMADALTALETVEGLEEFLNQSQFPENAVPESPAIPRTATRTSVRRKPIKEETETAQPMTRTRRTTRKVIDQDLETPEVQTGRRRTQAISNRRKVEEASVQRGAYSTRRSVRLLEKSMGDLSLKEERGMTETVKMDVLDETEEKDVLSGNMEKTNDSSSGETFIQMLESERELKDDVQEKDVSVLDAEGDSNDRASNESDEMGTVDAPVTEFTCETENPSAKDHKADESGVDCLAGDAHVLVSESPSESENASAKEMESEKVSDELSPNVAAGQNVSDAHVLDSESPSESENASAEEMESENVSDEFSPKVAADQKDIEALLPEEEHFELPFDSDSESWETDSDQSSGFDEDDVEEVLCVEKESFQFDNVRVPHGSEELNVEMEESDSDGLVDVIMTEGEVVISYEDNSAPSDSELRGNIPISASEIDSISEDKAVTYAEDQEIKMELVDVNVMPAEELDLATSLPPLPVTPTSGKQMSPYYGGKILGRTQMSPLGADRIATQFPRPTQSTPKKSSGKKKQTTDQKLTLLPANNKENIDNTSGVKVEPKKDKVKKEKKIELLDGISRRKLIKLIKEAEQAKIHNNKKNNDDEQVAAKSLVGKTRPALQTLPENVNAS